MDFYVVLTVFCLFTPSYEAGEAVGITLTRNEYFVPAVYWLLINIFYIGNSNKKFHLHIECSVIITVSRIFLFNAKIFL